MSQTNRYQHCPFVPRKFAEQFGVVYPTDAAGREGDRYVTWSEWHDRRRQIQVDRLKEIRRVETPRIVPCYVWTFYVPGWLYAGWHCYVVTRHEQVGVTFRGFDQPLAESIMRAIPLGMLPLTEGFERWMIAFAKTYPRKKPKHDRRRAGTHLGWYDRQRRLFALDRETLTN